MIDNHNERICSDSSEEISELANSMSSHGLLCPILLRRHSGQKTRFEVIFGGRRVVAAKRLGWESIDANVVDVSDVELVTLFLSENIDRKDLADYEKALALKKLHEASGKTYSEIAKQIGKSVSFVSLHTAMLDLFPNAIAPSMERSKVLSKLSERHARALSRIEDPLERWNTAKLAISAQLGVRELERIVKRYKNKKTRDSKKLQSRSIADVIAHIVIGLNSLDVRPLFDSVSAKEFSLFSRFPPFNMMSAEEGRNHVVDVLSKLDRFHYKITDMQIHNAGKFAYVTLQVLHEIGFEGRKIRTKSRATVIMQRMNGCWKIVHEHWSSANPEEQTWKLPSFNLKRQTYEQSIIQRMR